MKLSHHPSLGSFYTVTLVTGVLLTRCAFAQSGEKPELFEGHIGGTPIVMELTTDKDNVVTGRYFYRKHSMDIALDGSQLKNGDIQLGENQDYDDHSKIDMTLHPDPQDPHGLQGTWTGHDLKHLKNLAIQLKPILSTQKANYSLSSDTTDYDQIRLASLTLQKKNTTHFGNYSLQWWKEPISKISFFRIISGYPKDTMTHINAALTSRQWQEVNSFFQCQFDGARRMGAEYEQTVMPRFMNNKVFSISVDTSYYCGGAHPDFGDSPLNINVKTGKELQLEDVLWLGNTTTQLKRNPRGEQPDYDYESKILSPWISKTMAKLYPQEVGSVNQEDSCDYRDPEVWSSPAFYFTPQGLHLAASFYRAARACDNPDWAILPWKIVNQHQGMLKMALP